MCLLVVASWARPGGSFTCLCDCKAVVDIVTGVAALWTSHLKPLFSDILKELTQLVQGLWVCQSWTRTCLILYPTVRTKQQISDATRVWTSINRAVHSPLHPGLPVTCRHSTITPFQLEAQALLRGLQVLKRCMASFKQS